MQHIEKTLAKIITNSLVIKTFCPLFTTINIVLTDDNNKTYGIDFSDNKIVVVGKLKNPEYIIRERIFLFMVILLA